MVLHERMLLRCRVISPVPVLQMLRFDRGAALFGQSQVGVVVELA